TMEMHHPEMSQTGATAFEAIVPVYSLVEGLSQAAVRKAVQSALDRCIGGIEEWIPDSMLLKYGLPDLRESISSLHRPPSEQDADALNEGASPWHRRLKFGELLAFQLGLLARRRELDSRTSRPVPQQWDLERRFLESLPFRLTGDQLKAIEEIGADMGAEVPMHRLLQGDVGSGKTLVAFVAMLRAAGAGRQAVLMAPTEVLAEQHHRTMTAWCRPLGMEAGLLTGGVDAVSRRTVAGNAASGEGKIFIGTHALIQQGVRFRDLALAVVDEQHRFGVLQRLALREKGQSPHFLVMTATPIPRSLSMAIYGDLDVTTLEEMPPERRPVKTLVFDESQRSRMYLSIAREVEAGRQVFIVYPLVEESPKLELLAAREMAKRYRENIFPHLRVGLLTGRMSTQEKEEAMRRFRSAEDQVLVATTVIEVGVDVPNATLMVVENAERFGLFQLHQLRGRVGRGGHESTCILMQGRDVTREAGERLRILAATNSGFRIAEADLRMRGPGDFLGVRQAGMPDFSFANPLRDTDLLRDARQCASELSSGGDRMPPDLETAVGRFWTHGLDITASG
ncbi:MAG: ATP-dependent DNA helicase RecG, partial [bacterium]